MAQRNETVEASGQICLFADYFVWNSAIEVFTRDAARKIGYLFGFRSAKLDDFIGDATSHIWYQIEHKKLREKSGIKGAIRNYAISQTRKNKRLKNRPGEELTEAVENIAARSPEIDKRALYDELAECSPWLAVVGCAIGQELSEEVIASAFDMTVDQFRKALQLEQRRFSRGVSS